MNYKVNNYEKKPSLNDDFYGYINYDWIKANKIPEDETRYTHFIETQLRINKELRDLLENKSNKYPELVKPIQLYKSYLDKEYRESKCINRLKKLTHIVDDIKTYKDLLVKSVDLLLLNTNAFFIMSIDTNIFDSNQNIIYISQQKIGLPNKNYYHDNKYLNIKKQYYKTIKDIHKEIYNKLSNDDLDKITKTIMNIEDDIAIILLNPDDRRDADKVYHKETLDSINKKYPDLYFKDVINRLCLLSDNTVNLNNFKDILMEHHNDNEQNYFNQLTGILKKYTISDWRKYLRFKIILKYMKLTNKRMCDIYFNMFNKTIRGQKKPKELWRSALAFTCSQFNDNISKLYNKLYFRNDKKKYMEEMVKNIKKATKDRIKNLDWMGNKTKEKALIKLDKMDLKLGYGNTKDRTYKHIKLTKCLIENAKIINRENSIYNLSRLGKQIDENDWDIPSYMVNAYFNPSKNEIIFPTAILQPPFIDMKKSDIYNYGNIGSIIGHEIIHGFDDQGSKFDEYGSLKDWWTKEDKQNFKMKVDKIIKMYSDNGINGKLTAGENIADFGAVIMPLYGLKYKLGKLTDDNIRDFYKSYATHWQYILTQESADERRLTDPHAFADQRVNLPLKNQPLFKKVFGPKEGDKMYIKSKDMLIIW
jgi:predicted metalloendopeptidase